MADPLITVDDILAALDGGEETLRRLAGDDGTGSYREARVDYAITVASEEAYGILLSGFDSNARVKALVAADVAARHAIVMIWREVITQGKDEFRLPDGRTVFSADARIGRDALREKARGAKRTSAEEVTGVGQSGLLRPRASAGPMRSIFRDSRGRPVGF